MAAWPRSRAAWRARQGRPGGAHDAEHFVEDPAPLVVVVVLDRPGRADAGVVHHDVEPAHRAGGFGDGGPDRGIVGHVGDDRVKVGAFGVGLDSVQHGDVGAAGGKQPGRGQADA